jgi:hypothetical protein
VFFSGSVEDTANHEVQTVGFVRIVGVNEKSRRQEGHFVCWDTWGWWYIVGLMFFFH